MNAHRTKKGRFSTKLQPRSFYYRMPADVAAIVLAGLVLFVVAVGANPHTTRATILSPQEKAVQVAQEALKAEKLSHQATASKLKAENAKIKAQIESKVAKARRDALVLESRP